jgi:serine protease Do
MSKKPILAGAILLVLTISVAALLIANFSNIKSLIANSQIEFNTKSPIETTNENLKDLNNAFIEISKAVTPSVVYIEVTNESTNQNFNKDNFEFFFGPDFKMDEMPSFGSGSGVIISGDGYILTNNHVVKDAKDKGIKVVLTDKREFTAKLIGTDPNTDIAVIKINADNLTVAAVGNSDEVEVGQWVLAIGNPLGLNNTVTSGIVSAIGRNIQITGDSYAINNFIQTDAAINPGNSGGALVDINGLVIGINSAIKTTSGYYQGYGFAIPINMAKDVASELIKSGKVERGYIGVSIKDVDNKEAKGLGLDETKGVLVQNVLEGSAGEEAGIETGDVILKVDGKEVNAANQLQTIIGSKRPGTEVVLTIFRNGKTIDKTVNLKPQLSDNKANMKDDKDLNSMSFESIGITVTDLPGSLKKEFDVHYGVYVKDVKHFTEAFNRGLRSGSIILEADKEKVESVDQLESIIDKKDKGDILILKVMTQQKNISLIAIEL